MVRESSGSGQSGVATPAWRAGLASQPDDGNPLILQGFACSRVTPRGEHATPTTPQAAAVAGAVAGAWAAGAEPPAAPGSVGACGRGGCTSCTMRPPCSTST